MIDLADKLALHFVLIADFNASPQEVFNFLEHQRLDNKYSVLAPTSPTCRTTGRILDFGIVSIPLLPIITLDLYTHVPWLAHFGLNRNLHLHCP